jgi:hypothetical protein
MKIAVLSWWKEVGNSAGLASWSRAYAGTYEEVIESLSRVVDAGLLLQIAARENVASRN